MRNDQKGVQVDTWVGAAFFGLMSFFQPIVNSAFCSKIDPRQILLSPI